MICRHCQTPMMPAYASHIGWKEICIKCGGESSAAAPAHITQEAGKQARIGATAFFTQDFPRAEKAFLHAAQLCSELPEYLWAMLLARYGIKYCHTFTNHGQTVAHIINYWKKELPDDLISETESFDRLCGISYLFGPQWSEYYTQECANIDRGLRQIRELDQSAKAFDIFLCFKETDDESDDAPTKEKLLLDLLYPELIANGLRVFYAPRSMQGKTVYDYEGYIHYALKRSKMLILLASSAKNAQAEWVKSEWMRYLNWNSNHPERVVTCTMAGMSPAQFPAQLKNIQSDLHAQHADLATAKWFSLSIQQKFSALSLQDQSAGHSKNAQDKQDSNDSSEAIRLEGKRYLEDENSQSDLKAFKCFETAAKMGNLDALNNAAYCYLLGRGVKKDPLKALDLYIAASKKGHAKSQYNVGLFYENGEFVDKNYLEASRHYQMAAQQGMPEAQFALATLYDAGRGVLRDREKSAQLYLAAAEQGHALAQFNLGCAYEWGEGVPQDDEMAFMWFQKAADQGQAEAQFNLAIYHQQGKGTAKNEKKAVEWYLAAARQGYSYAQNNLGQCYKYGNGISQSDQEAYKWFLASAQQGNSAGQNNLGTMYLEGRGVKKDYKKAVEWFQLAADKEDSAAQYNLAICYKNGWSVPADIEKAKFWYKAAAEQGDERAKNALDQLNKPKGMFGFLSDLFS